ncbi:MAG: hypothetical protein MZV70_28465 [Desulfobacterales bacterium]|nr:hypothetical protein [Desulfobacterales bacterium]
MKLEGGRLPAEKGEVSRLHPLKDGIHIIKADRREGHRHGIRQGQEHDRTSASPRKSRNRPSRNTWRGSGKTYKIDINREAVAKMSAEPLKPEAAGAGNAETGTAEAGGSEARAPEARTAESPSRKSRQRGSTPLPFHLLCPPHCGRHRTHHRYRKPPKMRLRMLLEVVTEPTISPRLSRASRMRSAVTSRGSLPVMEARASSRDRSAPSI